jgi:hypothetical protein
LRVGVRVGVRVRVRLGLRAKAHLDLLGSAEAEEASALLGAHGGNGEETDLLRVRARVRSTHWCW